MAQVSARVASGAELLTALLRANERLARRPGSSWPERLAKAVEKARRHGLFLGLDDGWLDMLD